jgi:protein-disulfide isomerase
MGTAMGSNKRPLRYDLKAADRKRDLLVRAGLTTVVMAFAVALVLYLVMSHHPKPRIGEVKAIRVTSGKLITKPGTNEPKVVLGLFEDFLCPACRNLETSFGHTINALIDTGAVAADYHMVAILDRQQNQHYSSRAAAAGYCVADQSIDAFRRFHASLFSPQVQPAEDASGFPDNAALIAMARQAGADGDVADCINSGRYAQPVRDLAAAANIRSTPTIRINGEDYRPTTPDDMISKIKGIVGDVPGLGAA